MSLQKNEFKYFFIISRFLRVLILLTLKSVVLASQNPDGTRNILDDFREAYYWLRTNTDKDARIMSWWDYGYQIAGMADRTTLVDNNTWNNTHIALVGKAMASNETEAYKIMQELNVNYILVIFGGLIGYSGDDINKFLWMVRIAEGEHPNEIKESNYFTPQVKTLKPNLHTLFWRKSLNIFIRVNTELILLHRKHLPTLLCTKPVFIGKIKKEELENINILSFGEVATDYSSPAGYDRTRNSEVGVKNIKVK